MVQRKLKIGHDKAGAVMDGLQNAGIISPVAEGTAGDRDILMDAEEARAVLLSGPQSDSPADHSRFAELARSALAGVRDSGEIDALIEDPVWPTLASVLEDAQQAGHEPGELLAAVAGPRDIDAVSKAKSFAAVLAWRVRKQLADTGPAATPTKTTGPGAGKSAGRGVSPRRPRSGPDHGRGR